MCLCFSVPMTSAGSCVMRDFSRLMIWRREKRKTQNGSRATHRHLQDEDVECSYFVLNFETDVALMFHLSWGWDDVDGGRDESLIEWLKLMERLLQVFTSAIGDSLSSLSRLTPRCFQCSFEYGEGFRWTSKKTFEHSFDHLINKDLSMKRSGARPLRADFSSRKPSSERNF